MRLLSERKCCFFFNNVRNELKWPDNSFIGSGAAYFSTCAVLKKKHQRRRKSFSAAPWVMKGFNLFPSVEDSERRPARCVGFPLFPIDLGQSQKWHKYHEGSGTRKPSRLNCARLFIIFLGLFVENECGCLLAMTLTARVVRSTSEPVHDLTSLSHSSASQIHQLRINK